MKLGAGSMCATSCDLSSALMFTQYLLFSALTSWVITRNLILALARLGIELGLEIGIGFRVRVRVRLRVSGPLLAFIPGLPLPSPF